MSSILNFEDQLQDSFRIEKNKLIVPSDYFVAKENPYILTDILPQAVNSDICYPEYLGYIYNIKPVNEYLIRSNLDFEIIHLYGTLLGIEFNKTVGKKSTTKNSIYLHVLNGKCAIVIHKSTFNESNFKYVAEDAILLFLNKGQTIIIPPDTGYTIINIKFDNLVILKAKYHDSVETNVFNNHKGAAIYLIHKNSQFEIVNNPYFYNNFSYKRIPKKSIQDSIFNTHLSWLELINYNDKKNLDPKIECVLGKSDSKFQDFIK